MDVRKMQNTRKKDSKENLRCDFVVVSLLGLLYSYSMFSWSRTLSIFFGIFALMMIVCAKNDGQFLLYGNDFSKAG